MQYYSYIKYINKRITVLWAKPKELNENENEKILNV